METSTRIQRESRLLIAIFGAEALDVRSEAMTNENDNELLGAVTDALAEQQRAIARAGKMSPFWCFYCGVRAPELSGCACPFPESFGCAGKRVCAECQIAHRSVASHLQEMFRAKRVDRVSSIRNRLYSDLYSAALEVGDEDNCSPKELHFRLAQADAFDDEPDDFRQRILASFGKVRFLQYKELAAAIEREKQDRMVSLMVRAGLFR